MYWALQIIAYNRYTYIHACMHTALISTVTDFISRRTIPPFRILLILRRPFPNLRLHSQIYASILKSTPPPSREPRPPLSLHHQRFAEKKSEMPRADREKGCLEKNPPDRTPIGDPGAFSRVHVMSGQSSYNCYNMTFSN